MMHPWGPLRYGVKSYWALYSDRASRCPNMCLLQRSTDSQFYGMLMVIVPKGNGLTGKHLSIERE